MASKCFLRIEAQNHILTYILSLNAYLSEANRLWEVCKENCTWTYDANGNITSEKVGGKTTSYVYDSANQLIRENNQEAGKTWIWTYDEAGNILFRKEYAYSNDALGSILKDTQYNYSDPNWGDLLTACGGKTLTHDANGNLIDDGTWSYTWLGGRQLSQMVHGNTTMLYSYNADGLRLFKTKNVVTTGNDYTRYDTVRHQYAYVGDLLTAEVITNETTTYTGIEPVLPATYSTNDSSVETVTTQQMLRFTYDANGNPVSVRYTNIAGNTAEYFYVTNLQGDVIALLNSSGTAVVTYTYNAWGEVISVGGSLASSIGQLNPLRYRGYVYDIETNLYYLQSRYYNPEWGRFISSDAYLSTGQGLLGNNMFAYCNNNPVNMSDSSGQFPWLILGVIAVTGIIGGILGALADSKLGNEFIGKKEISNPSPMLPNTTESVCPQVTDILTQDENDELTLGDRVMNTFIGATLGLAAGGLIVATAGAIGSVAVGSATTYIALFGATGAQTYAIGALAYNVFAMLTAPLVELEIEPLEKS